MFLYVLPTLLGISLRLLFRKSLRDYLVTGVLGILVLIFAAISAFVYGYNVFGVLGIIATSAFAGSLATGILLLLISVAKR